MIKGINASGKYMSVQGGTASDPYISPGSAGAGMMRWNPNMNCMEVNDGTSWKQLMTNYASIGLSQEAESLLDWASKKRTEELEYQRLASENQAVKIAMDNLDKAKQQLTITAKLAKDAYHDHGEVMEQASP